MKQWKQWITLIVFVLSGVIICIVFNKKINKEISLSVMHQCIENRACLDKEKELLIGNSEKELENNYYDIKVIEQNGKIYLYINKLWKTEFVEQLYEERYVNELVEYVACVVNKTYKLDTVSFKNAVVSGYIASKNGSEYAFEINDKNINIKLYSLNYELVVEVEKT